MPNSHGTEGANGGGWLTARRFALLLAVLVAVSFPQVLAGLQTFVYRDYGIFSYPLAFHFHECFWRGELPLWNPLNCCGVPFLAQWNTQVLYPPALFYLIFPLSWSLGVFCLLHLFFGGVGMFLLVERWIGNRLAAGFAGIIFAFSGLMLSSLIWPATVAGLGWMPWVIWLTPQAWRDGGRWVPLAAFAGGFQMLSGGVEAVLMSWVLLGGLWVVEFVRGENSRLKMACRAGLVVLLVAGLATAQLLPFFDLLACSRAQQGISAASWPMPATGWANFFTPLFDCSSHQGVFMQANQSWTNSYYVGALTVLLALAGCWRVRGDWRVWPLLALVLMCLLLAVGEATPIYPWLAQHFSFIGLMRFPVKFVILPEFALPLLAAMVFAKSGFAANGQGNHNFLGGIWAAGVTVILTLTWWPQPEYIVADDRGAILMNGLMRAICLTLLLAVWFSAKRFSGPGLMRWELLFLFLVWLDLFHQMPWPSTVDRAAYQPGLSRRWTPPQPGLGRVQLRGAVYNRFYHSALPDVTDDFMARRFAMLADCNLLDDVAKCDGFYPLYPSVYVAWFFVFYHDSEPAEGLLDFLGVSQALVSHDGRLDWQPRSTALPMLTAGQAPRYADNLEALQILTNADFNPRQVVVLPAMAKPYITVTNVAAAKLESVTYSDQRIDARVETSAPALVVVAQTYYPGWRAYVDGKPTHLWPANYAFQGFEVPPGNHQIRVAYEDRKFRLGAVISLSTLAGCLLCWLLKRRRRAI